MKLKQFNFKKVKSTNQTAIRLIRSSKNEFGLIISEAQLKGKGQYGRKWISYKGNILISFFYKIKKINLILIFFSTINFSASLREQIPALDRYFEILIFTLFY